MADDERIVLLGEDVGARGGVFRISDGWMEEFGEERVIDTPLAESGIIGIAIGMALHGLLPIAEIQFADFIHPASTRSSPRPRACDTGRTATSAAAGDQSPLRRRDPRSPLSLAVHRGVLPHIAGRCRCRVYWSDYVLLSRPFAPVRTVANERSQAFSAA